MDPRKRLVRDCYDTIVDAFAEEYRRRPTDYLDDDRRERAWFARFVAALPPRARVLDLGCGNGEPYLRELTTRGFGVVALDFSHQQLRRAHAFCPDALVVEGDMSEAEFADAAFDGIIAYHSIWNLPRQEHAALFARARRWLVDGGVALMTMTAIAAAEFVDGPGLFTELCGAPTFYDAHRADVPLALIEAAGFEIVDCDPPPPGHAANRVLIVLGRAR